MSMTVAELFVNLGIKGANDLSKTLTGVQSGLQKTAEMSWQAKAGIFAAVVGLEEISRSAVGAAMDLQTFEGATGLSGRSIQRMDYWAKRNNVSVQELHGSIHNLQIMQSKMLAGDQGARRALTFFGIDPYQNADAMLQNLFKKIRTVGNNPQMIGLSRMFAEQLGVGVNMYAAARVGDPSTKGFTKQMELLDTEKDKLLKLNRSWADFWMTVQGTSQKTVANDLAGPITGFVDILRDDVEEAATLIKKLAGEYKRLSSPEFETTLKAIGAALLIALAPLAPYTAALVALGAVLEEMHKVREGKEEAFLGLFPGLESDEVLKKRIEDRKKSHGSFYNFMFGGADRSEVFKRQYETAARANAIGPTRAEMRPVTVTNNNHFVIQEARDAEKVGRTVNGHLQKAAVQNAAVFKNK